MARLTRHLSAGAVVLVDGGIVLVQNRRGHWGLPKGHVEEGEPLAVAARREVAEEAGLEVEVGALAFITEFFWPEAGEHLTQVFFVGRPVGGHLRPRPGETLQVRVVPAADLRRYLSWRPWVEPLEEWLKTGRTGYHVFRDPSRYRMA